MPRANGDPAAQSPVNRIRPIVTILEDRRLLSTPTLTTLGSSSSSTVYGQTELFTATVTTSPPSGTTPSGGTVSFLDGSTVLSTENLTSGTAEFSTTGLPAGLHVVTAEYSGSTAFGGSTSGTSDGLIINTVAGGGQGNGNQATSAMLNEPRGLAVNSSGDIFIVDSGNNQVLEVDPATGVLTTFAGTGTSGYSGDGGAATKATLNLPDGIAVDSQGNLFIADTQNNVIREVNATTGLITTVAGNGTAGFSGDGGPATAAELDEPSGVFVDSGENIFIADTGNSVVREIRRGQRRDHHRCGRHEYGLHRRWRAGDLRRIGLAPQCSRGWEWEHLHRRLGKRRDP